MIVLDQKKKKVVWCVGLNRWWPTNRSQFLLSERKEPPIAFWREMLLQLWTKEKKEEQKQLMAVTKQKPEIQVQHVCKGTLIKKQSQF